MIIQQTISELSQNIKNKEITCVQATQAYLDQIEKYDGDINSYVAMNEKAIDQAQALDKDLAAGKDIGPLGGIPVGIKDMLCTEGLATTAGSKILKNYIPPYSSTVVERLQSAGSVILGKCNQDEFAMGSSNELSAWGDCKNPWNTEYVPGGSSGGSAAGVAGGMAAFSIGTDTGGSVRQPASFCGVVGVKPTYGRVSRYGIIAFASSLDQAGPLTKSVKDSALVMESICGYDAKDSTSSKEAVPQWSQQLTDNIKGLKVGIPREFLDSSVDEEVREAVEKSKAILVAQGAEIVEVSLPYLEQVVPVYYMVATSEASSNLARYDGVRYGQRADFSEQGATSLDDFYSRTRGDGFGSEVKRRIILGTYALSSGYYDAYYKKACQVRRLIREGFIKAFSSCDILLGPVSSSPAFKIGARIKDPLKMYKNDIFTASTNLAGLPGMSVPAGINNQGLPIGVQIIAPDFSEQNMLNAAYAIEKNIELKERFADVLR